MSLLVTMGLGTCGYDIDVIDVVVDTPAVAIEVSPDEVLDLSIEIDDPIDVAVELPEDEDTEVSVTDEDLNVDVEVC